MRLPAVKDSRRWWWIAAVVAGLVVFFCHCRPWEVGLLEEWGFADAWNRHGWSALSTVELGRPLQNLVVYVGLLPGWGIVGIQIVLGLTAVGQFLVVLRFGGRGEPSRRWLALLVALVVALHPLWPAGFILRFLAAQIAILATLGALSLALRQLRGGRSWLLVPSAALVIVALLTYQAPALVLPLVALALAVALPSIPLRRRITTLVVLVAAVAISALWSTVIAQKLAPAGSTYESTLLGSSGAGGGLETVKTILKSIAHIPLTLATRSPATIVAIVAILLLLLLLHRRLGMRPRVTAALVGLTVLAPAASIPYAISPIQVLDPERVSGPAALMLEIVLLLWCLLSPPSAVALQTGVAGALLVAAGVATVISIGYYGRFAAIQRSMLELVRPAVTQATGRQEVLIEDGSGELGDVYTGFDADLSASSHVYTGDPTDVVMCTLDGVTRHHPVAAVYPLTTTPSCSALHVPGDARLISRGEIAGGPVRVYVVDGPLRVAG